MRLLVLLSPGAVLGLLWALQRIEVWMIRPSAAPTERAHGQNHAGASPEYEQEFAVQKRSTRATAL